MTTSLEWLADNFPEVDSLAFYRDLFPSGCLDKAGAFTKGKYCGIAVQVTKSGKAKRFSLTDDLANLPQILSSDDFTVISPVSYAGKSQKGENQRELYAFAVDLDNLIITPEGYPTGIASLFSQIEYGEKRPETMIVPRPTYVVASADNNVHCYYMFEQPLPLFKSNKECLSRYKSSLTATLWNGYITNDSHDIQQEPIGQSMRAVGSIRKDGTGRVRAFLTGERVTVDWLNQFTFVLRDACQIKIWDSPTPRQKKVTSDGNYAAATKPWVYEWYKEQLNTYAAEGRRYFQIMVLAVFARKCGISYEKVKQDALDLVPMMDEKTKRPDNHFTKKQALQACTAYEKEHFVLMKRETLMRLSGVPMKGNKRNGRPQNLHLMIARGNRAVLNSVGEGHAHNAGRPSKKAMVFEYLSRNPDATPEQVMRELGISRSTVYRWVKEFRQQQAIQEE